MEAEVASLLGLMFIAAAGWVLKLFLYVKVDDRKTRSGGLKRVGRGEGKSVPGLANASSDNLG